MAREFFTQNRATGSAKNAGAMGVSGSIRPTVAHAQGETLIVYAQCTYQITQGILASRIFNLGNIFSSENTSIYIQGAGGGGATNYGSQYGYTYYYITTLAYATQADQYLMWDFRWNARYDSKISGNATITDLHIIIGNASPVVAGNPIYKTDFDAVLQPATIGNTITNSNFTTGNIITASEWNNKWRL